MRVFAFGLICTWCIGTMTLPRAVIGQHNGQAAPDDHTQLKSIGELYLHNRSAFDFFTCRFEVVDGNAANVEEAVKRGPTRNRTKATGIWIKDGDKVRYELSLVEGGDKRLAGELRKSAGSEYLQGTSTIAPRKFIANGDNALGMNPILQSAGVYSQDSPSDPVTVTPFDMGGIMGSNGKLNPGDMLTEWYGSNPAVAFSYVGRQTSRNISCDVFVANFVEDDGPKGPTITFFIDKLRGCLPVEMTIGVEGVISDIGVMTDTIECSDGRWFPSRVVKIMPSSGSPKSFYVRELRVVALDADSRPAASQFNVTVPAQTVLHNGDPKSAVAFKADKQVNLADIAELVDLTNRKAQQERADEPTGENWSLPSLIILNVVAIVMVGLFFFARRLRLRAST